MLLHPRRALNAMQPPSLHVLATDKNRLLASLPGPTLEKWQPYLEPVDLSLGCVIHEPGAELAHVYFPVTAIASLIYVMEDGSSAEVAVVGNDGMVGLSVFMGGNTTPSRAIVQSAGHSYRVQVSRFASLLEQDITLQRLLLRYTQSLLTQMALTAVCNRHHTLHQQFCRWLLLSLDRLPGNELIMTQELIANMLGVRRQGVTAAASKLQAQGAITYHRGRITVLNRSKLERCSCECYQVVARECARLMRGSA